MTRSRPALLLVAGALLFARSASAQPVAALVRVAEVVSTSGTVEFRRGDGAPWAPARKGQELTGRDALRTHTLAFAKLKFEVGMQWDLAAASELRLGEIDPGATTRALQVRLERGGAVALWNPDRRPSATARAGTPAPKVVVQTDSGQATITGTEWSIRVDDSGRTAVFVRDGAVELANDHGNVTVRANESAEMRVGQPPVLRLLSPRDRVQWVADYAAQPARFAALESGAARAALDLAVAATASGDTAAAIERLERQAANGAAPAGIVLALTDLLIAAGDLEGARERAEAGRVRFAADARFDALLSRIALFEDRTADSRTLAESATVKDPKSVEAWLALGEWARREGDGAVASRAFRQATIVNPGDARGWFGQGSVETEREVFVAARRSLTEALKLDPDGPGFRGEMGTLETLANRLTPAEREYQHALAARPEDYVALTGRALLALKQGREAEALELLLKAGLMEPRYARAQLYLGVTYYRLRRHDDAIRALRRASELDAKDPLPYMMATAIHTDLFEPAKALEAARKARDLMPYLKSLNQLSNTQQGTTNLGNSVAFFGMEPWAQHLAQESYNPFWAGSHLFLGDRYTTAYARASEYYQGLLMDPTVFGGSPLFQTLLPRGGHYQSADVSTGRDAARLRRADSRASANGYLNSAFPIGYAVSVKGGEWHATNRASDEAHSPRNFAAAVGFAPSSRWGLFAAGSTSGERLHIPFNDAVALWSGTGGRFDTGVNFRPSPRSSMAVKGGVGAGQSDTPLAPMIPELHLSGHDADAQARYTLLLAGGHEVSAGFNAATEEQGFAFTFNIPPFSSRVTVRRDLGSRQAFASTRTSWGPAMVQADLFINRETSTIDVNPTPYADTTVEPRIGASIRLGQGVLRGAFQKWTRPLAASGTLGPVATAGVPLDDRFIENGGSHRRARAQIEWEWSAKTFTTAFADHQKIDNLAELNGFGREFALVLNPSGASASNVEPYFAKALTHLRDVSRDASRLNVNAHTALEGNPDVLSGRVSTVGFTFNRVLTTMVSTHAEYGYTHSSEDGRPFLFVPAHALALGATYVSPRRVYLSAGALRRSSRSVPAADDGRAVRPSDWAGRLSGYWETRDKRWAIEVTAGDLFAKNAASTYSVAAKIRR